jgi:hypothetical protein
MALETRAFRDRDLHHLVFNFDPRRHLATKPPLPLFRWLQWLRRVVHAARLDHAAALQSFQPGDLFAPFADRLVQSSDFAKQLNQQSFKLRTAQIGKWG